MAERSFDIYLKNNTRFTLALKSTDGVTGMVTAAPPSQIDSGDTGHWALENAGMMTGCEASVVYGLTGQSGQVQVRAAAPFEGDNRCWILAIDGAEQVVSPDPSGEQNPDGSKFTFKGQLNPV
ncbi:MAG: hypothetical protein ACRC67_24510 [Inquilinus sp.]|uniref:hypothetical protein n=1 Tax=Inquilinus sp. TaxID=1932117 RepID=UPI003F2DB078